MLTVFVYRRLVHHPKGVTCDFSDTLWQWLGIPHETIWAPFYPSLIFCYFVSLQSFVSASPKGDSAFAWISAQPLLEPLLNMHTTFYMSVITYLHIPAIHETNALREVLWQRVGKFLLKSTIALWSMWCQNETLGAHKITNGISMMGKRVLKLFHGGYLHC